MSAASTRNHFSATRFKALFIKQRKDRGDPTDFGMNPARRAAHDRACADADRADALQVQDSNKNVLFNITACRSIAGPCYAAIADAVRPRRRVLHGAGAVQLRGRRRRRDRSYITPAVNAIIPNNAIIVGGIINPTTAPVGATATIGFGTLAGSSAASIKAATAIASYTLDALLPVIPVFTAALRPSK